MTVFSPDNIDVSSIRVYYDTKTSTKTNETQSLLQYESQHFRCKVQIEINSCEAISHWSIGLVQACDHMYLENKYGFNGSSFWEFHPLKSGRHIMVNDSDGRQYPFYSLTSSKYEIEKGRVSESTVTLHYEDHFYPTVAWELPYNGGVRLTDVIRKQDFWVWLVAIQRGADNTCMSYDLFDPREDSVFILKTMRWRYNLHMKFDPEKPVGHRVQCIHDAQSEIPVVLDYNKKIPISAFSPPHCNAAQSLIWYSKNSLDKPKILVPPKQTIVPWENWVDDMSSERKIKASKPKDCMLVGEWPDDQDIGIICDSNTYGNKKIRKSSSIKARNF